ncbi:MAG: 3-phosphoshikimate 1-carboxyvinyltransferase [Tenericutes bacterium]|nr:3-phosphoshikimate 1-carboxyvinyltransferase [Mycoplasmatota bacterium]
MIVEVYKSKVSGSIKPPPSKSYLHRSIICAALSKGTSVIKNIIYSSDINASLSAFENLGVSIKRTDNSVEITSKGLLHLEQDKVVNCNESGSTIRFLIPIFSNSYNTYFKGKSGLMRRPFTIYEDIFRAQNLTFEQNDDTILTKGQISPGNYKVKGDVSSQFISGLLFVLPTLSGDSTIEIIGKLESSMYVDITVQILKMFGIIVDFSENKFTVKGNQKYISTTVTTEIDYSQSAFYAVLGIINNNIQISDFSSYSLQPDRNIINIVKSMSGLVKTQKNSVEFCKSNTKGTVIDVSQCPDIAPILGLLAACSAGETNIINARRLIIKESNRLLSTYETLKSLGVEVYMAEDSLRIIGTKTIKGNSCSSFNDHRIVMTLAIAGTVCDSKVVINNAEAVNKSYPHFFKDLQSLGAIVKYK